MLALENVPRTTRQSVVGKMPVAAVLPVAPLQHSVGEEATGEEATGGGAAEDAAPRVFWRFGRLIQSNSSDHFSPTGENWAGNL